MGEADFAKYVGSLVPFYVFPKTVNYCGHPWGGTGQYNSTKRKSPVLAGFSTGLDITG